MRIVNLGLPKSGTTSLQRVLELFGLTSSHWTVSDSETGAAKAFKYVGEVIYSNYLGGRSIFEGFSPDSAITQLDVCVPSSGLNLWPQLDPLITTKIPKQYPGCKILLLKRDPRKVVSSMKKWNDLLVRLVASDIPGLPAWRGLCDDELLGWVAGHYESIECQFSGYSNFMSLDIEDKDSFESFVAFAGLASARDSLPCASWPIANKSTDSREFSSELYWIAKELADTGKRLDDRTGEIRRQSLLIGELRGEKALAIMQVEDLHTQVDAGACRVDELEKACVRQLSRLSELEVDSMQLNEQLTAREGELSEARKVRDEREARMKAIEGEVAQLSEQLQVAELLTRERGIAIEHLQRELQEFRMQAAQLRQALQPQECWQLWLEQEQQALVAQRAFFNAEVEHHRADLRELEVLRVECARRYAMVQRSEQLQLQLQQARQSCDEYQSRLQASEREVAELRQQPAARPAEVTATAFSAEIQVLEQQLQEAQDESQLLLLQLHQVQEELEHYYLLSLNQPSAPATVQPDSQPQADPQADTDAINAFRQRLLASR